MTHFAKIRAVIHKAEDGGYWAEVPALPGCVTEADTLAELRKNIQVAVDLYLDGKTSKALERARAERPYGKAREDAETSRRKTS